MAYSAHGAPSLPLSRALFTTPHVGRVSVRTRAGIAPRDDRPWNMDPDEQGRQHMDRPDEDEVVERRRVGDDDHSPDSRKGTQRILDARIQLRCGSFWAFLSLMDHGE